MSDIFWIIVVYLLAGFISGVYFIDTRVLPVLRSKNITDSSSIIANTMFNWITRWPVEWLVYLGVYLTMNKGDGDFDGDAS